MKSTIPDFTELYVEWIYRYHQRTGDDATLASLYPVVQNITGYVWRYVDPATGLVTQLPGGGTTYAYGIVDWPPEMRYGYDMSTVARTTVNILGANVFNRAAVMAQILGDLGQRPALPPARPGHRGRPQRPAGQRRRRLHRRPAGRRRPEHPRLPAGQRPGSRLRAGAHGRVATVGAHVASLGIALGCDHGLELVRALHAAGLDADLVRIVTDPNGPGWGHILATGGTFCWESWTPSDLEQDSLSHGWGSGALVGLHEAMLGATVTGPGAPVATEGGGLTLLQVRPPSGGLAHAAGTLPTVAGPVAVRWAKGSGANALRLALSLPANAQAQVTLPARGGGGGDRVGPAPHPVPGRVGHRLVERPGAPHRRRRHLPLRRLGLSYGRTSRTSSAPRSLKYTSPLASTAMP